MTWHMPLATPDFDDAETRAVLDVLERKWLTMGPVTERFEGAFASATGAAHAAAVANGTAALHLACLALGIGPGDEVIVPSLTFVATANAVVYCGATPVFAEITSEDDWTISAQDVERRITDRTAAIIVMHYGGHPCDMPAILDVARRHGVSVIEDCAHAPLAVLDGRCAGTFGAAGCFSFYANKNLAVGEGGIVVTDDADLAERMRRLRCHGMSSVCIDRHLGAGPLYDVTELGYNCRLDEIRAAIGVVQLEKLPRNNARRRELTAHYRAGVAAIDGVSMPFGQTRGEPAYHICPVLLDEGIDRAGCIEILRGRGIQTSVHYTPVHRFRYYREYWGGETCVLPLSEMVGARELTLPLHALMTADDVDEVVGVLGEAIRESRRPARAGGPARNATIVT